MNGAIKYQCPQQEFDKSSCHCYRTSKLIIAAIVQAQKAPVTQSCKTQHQWTNSLAGATMQSFTNSTKLLVCSALRHNIVPCMDHNHTKHFECLRRRVGIGTIFWSSKKPKMTRMSECGEYHLASVGKYELNKQKEESVSKPGTCKCGYDPLRPSPT